MVTILHCCARIYSALQFKGTWCTWVNLLLPSSAELTNSKFVVCRFFFVFVQITGKKSRFYRDLINSVPMHRRILIVMYNLTEDERKKNCLKSSVLIIVQSSTRYIFVTGVYEIQTLQEEHFSDCFQILGILLLLYQESNLFSRV